MQYDKVCATKSIEKTGSVVVGGSFFKNADMKDISASCLDDQAYYDEYKECDDFIAGLLSEDYLDQII